MFVRGRVARKSRSKVHVVVRGGDGDEVVCWGSSLKTQRRVGSGQVASKDGVPGDEESQARIRLESVILRVRHKARFVSRLALMVSDGRGMLWLFFFSRGREEEAGGLVGLPAVPWVGSATGSGSSDRSQTRANLRVVISTG